MSVPRPRSDRVNDEMLTAVSAATFLERDKIFIRKIGRYWYIMLRCWDRVYVREFVTHRLALSVTLWMTEVDTSIAEPVPTTHRT